MLSGRKCHNPKPAASTSAAQISVVIRERFLNILLISSAQGQHRLRWRAVDLSWPKSLPILRRGNERLDHLGLLKVAVELIQLRDPKVVTGKICIRRIVGI